MKYKQKILILVALSMFVSIGVVISPTLRFEGFAPTVHFVNVVCSVLLGSWYSLANAVITTFIRMILLNIPTSCNHWPSFWGIFIRIFI